MQAAYEVLSDPQERAWYDSHRETILGDVYGSENIQSLGKTAITTHDILRLISRFGSQVPFDDSSGGFYGALRSMIDDLALEEELSCKRDGKSPVHYPRFGFADDNYHKVVRPFYEVWIAFATQKSFSWMDLYRYSEAPDRRVRRLMEKENKRLREDGIREFNDAVRSLVAFAKKRDPRVPSSKEAEVDRQKILRDAAAAQALRSRQAHLAKMAHSDTVPEWMKPSDIEEYEDEESQDTESASQSLEFECVVCKKLFKSDNQYQSHAKSKKHLKNVKKAREDIAVDQIELGLSSVLLETCTEDFQGTEQEEHNHSFDKFYSPAHSTEQKHTSKEIQDEARSAASSIASCLDEVSDAPVTSPDTIVTENEAASFSIPSGEADILETGKSTHLEGDKTSERRKVGKAKAKRAKKAAHLADQKSPSDQLQHFCVTCKAAFTSRTKLFAHIKALNHGKANNITQGGGKR